MSITGSEEASIAKTRIGGAGWPPTMVLVEDRLDGFGAAYRPSVPSAAAPVLVLERRLRPLRITPKPGFQLNVSRFNR